MKLRACPHRPPCDGCPRFAEVGPDSEVLARLSSLAVELGCPLSPVEVGDAAGFRVRSRLAVRGTPTEPKLGLFQVRSHNIVDIPSCVIHHPSVNECALTVKRAIRATCTSVYHDAEHAGIVRYLQLVVERSTGRVQLVVVCNSESSAEVQPLLNRIKELSGTRLHSLWFNGNPSVHNVILGPIWEHVAGPSAVEELLAGTRVFFPPDAFGQANFGLFEAMLGRIHSFVPDAARVVEFHSGVGAIGLGLLERVQRVDFVEVADGGLRGLEMGLNALDPKRSERASLHKGLASAHAPLIVDSDVVIVDPPRRGLEAGLVEALCHTPPARFIYVSCGLDSFARDARLLQAAGCFRLKSLTPYDLVPFTSHVETLALFERC